jgi:carbohydrate kinase (thermoresistant glucokinase family)
VNNLTSELPCALVVMGVAGSGKSTIGEALSQRLGWRYADGDSFHPPVNVAKMSAGQPLTDEDRWPWLKAIAAEIERCRQEGQHIIIACSALKKAYRDILVHSRDDIRMVYLNGSHDLVADRIGHRKGHFMPPGLLDSQFAALEPPSPDERPIIVSIDASVEVIVEHILQQLQPDQTSYPLLARTRS